MSSHIFLFDSECKKTLSYVLNNLRVNISPEALISLCALRRNLSKKMFDTILHYIEKRLQEKNIVIIEESLIREAIRTIITEKKPRLEPKKPEKDKPRSLIEILTQKQKEIDKKMIEKEPEEIKISTEEVEEIKKLVVSQEISEPKQKIEYEEFLEPTEKLEILEGMKPKEKEVEIPITMEKERKIVPKSSVKIVKKIEWYTLNDSTETFRQYFLSRYNKLKRIIRENIYGKIVDASTLTTGRYKDTYLVLIVDSKKTTKGGNGLIIGEDENSRVRVYVPFDRYPEIKDKFQRIILDTVIAVKIDTVTNKKLIIASDIIFPNIPRLRERHRASRSIKVLVASDLHIGSKVFMKKNFEKFIEFLKAKTKDEKLNALAEEIEYILLTGDLVDGVGVYPDQKNELAIFDHKKQYETLANYLKEIPDDKQIICIPGNHDVSTRIIPQPPIAEELAKPLYELSTIELLSNPVTIEIDKVRLFMYHGQGFERIAGLLGIPLTRPTKIIKEILRFRHVHAEWGTLPQAPLPEDFLVIEETPDIVLTGHLHIYDTGTYRGTAMLSSGAFEGLTTWQRDMGIEPTIGYFHVIDLSNYQTLTFQATETRVRLVQSQQL